MATHALTHCWEPDARLRWPLAALCLCALSTTLLSASPSAPARTGNQTGLALALVTTPGQTASVSTRKPGTDRSMAPAEEAPAPAEPEPLRSASAQSATTPSQSPPASEQRQPEHAHRAAAPTDATPAPATTGQPAAATAISEARGLHDLPEMARPLFATPPSPPHYPLLARKRGQTGTVWLEVRLDAEGVPRQLALARSSGFALLDEAALAAVRAWRFVPLRLNGSAHPSRVRIPVEFSLH